jgi:XTP/dITP diphosphohydrolase
MEICFATNNLNKLKEINTAVTDIQILSLKDINCNEELPETTPTLEGNSIQKAQHVFDNYNINCFADDTGLEVNILQGEPGVYSARYAGEPSNSKDNMDLLLQKLEGKTDRSAQFRTVITLIIDGNKTQFEGVAKGVITQSKHGEQGFGYDPIFIPEGYKKTFAELTIEEKNKISHRGIAVRKLINYLNTL